MNKPKSEYEDLIQCNNLPSSATPRGHQMPAAFLVVASGLNKLNKYKDVDVQIPNENQFQQIDNPCLVIDNLLTSLIGGEYSSKYMLTNGLELLW
ncbi:unnamed protein product [Trichobilharzia regenti]|nr:unnamed protein product [Trichobilharzia regenti]